MDFAMSAKATDYHKRLSDFMTEYVFPAEAAYDSYRHEAGPDTPAANRSLPRRRNDIVRWEDRGAEGAGWSVS